MPRVFNIAGPCVPEKHYMLPTEARCADLRRLIDEELFFVIHAARQSGKTTLMHGLAETLNNQGQYHALYCSLETVQGIHEAQTGIPAVVRRLASAVEMHPVLSRQPFAKDADLTDYTNVLRVSFTRFCQGLDHPLVVLFDEVDCLAEGTLISFLRQLRDGYVNRAAAPFVHSLALVGMRNIRDYKARVRPDRETLGTASPFNIVSESLTLRNFSRDEIDALYAQHTEATGQVFPAEVVNQAFDWTRGQPWLVNAVAREMVEKIGERDWGRKLEPAMVEDAAQRIILRRDTHIDSLMERLKEERVRRVVEPILLGTEGAVRRLDDDYLYVRDLGLIREDDDAPRPANRIYAEVMVRTLSYDSQRDLPVSLEGRWITPQGVDLDGLLREFQQFWRENGEAWAKRYDYQEAAPHLILQAFLQRVVNGGASVAREFALGRGRLDLCVSHGGRHYVIELKLRRSVQTVKEGLEQIAGYMDATGAQDGWLIIFDRRPRIPWKRRLYWRKLTRQGRRIRVIGC
ncbi:MAG: AAA-like domain-containing protein [Verrucomicrobia bacterium]|nr:AAA-like domain-containing protein [Verrucomicrobiota bacterium]